MIDWDTIVIAFIALMLLAPGVVAVVVVVLEAT